jgi:hypothetical protein
MPGEPIIVWLLQEAGEIFLGLASSSRAPGAPMSSRYCVLGKMHGSDGVGVWIDVDIVQERSVPTGAVANQWNIDPKLCFIKWAYVAYLQKGKTSKPSMGFLPVSLKVGGNLE